LEDGAAMSRVFGCSGGGTEGGMYPVSDVGERASRVEGVGWMKRNSEGEMRCGVSQ